MNRKLEKLIRWSNKHLGEMNASKAGDKILFETNMYLQQWYMKEAQEELKAFSIGEK